MKYLVLLGIVGVSESRDPQYFSRNSVVLAARFVSFQIKGKKRQRYLFFFLINEKNYNKVK